MALKLNVSLALAALTALGLAAARPTQAQTTLTGQYVSSGGNGYYTNASALPVSTTNDLIYNLAPISTNYVGDYEAAGGTTAPLTDGMTATDGSADKNQATSAGNALFDFNHGNWYATYSLGSNPLGYDLSSIVVTTGHQDFRVDQDYDILLATVTDPSLTSLNNGAGFVYSPSGGSTGYAGGAAQTTLTETGGGLLATGVTQVEFLVRDNGSDVYRELGVFGSPTPSAAPEPSQMAGLGFTALGILGLLGKARKRSAGQRAA